MTIGDRPLTKEKIVLAELPLSDTKMFEDPVRSHTWKS